jgi:hypothetical protein
LLILASAGDEAPVFRNRKKPIDNGSAAAQIRDRLKQRDNVDVELGCLRTQEAAFTKQNRRFENIGHAMGH